jgi:hypothetical protein
MSAALMSLGAFLLLAAPALARGEKNIIRGDFLVNADTLSRDFTRNAKSAADRYGNYVVAWEDDCNGDHDIYARRFSAGGTALGPSFRVNDDATNLNQVNPCVAMNWSGKFVIAWQDQRDLIENIYYQCYDAAGTALGGNRVGNGDAMDWMTQRYPAAAMDGKGGFVLVWADEQSIYWGIFAQRFDSTGAKLGNEFQVDENPDYENLYDPSVGMDLAGNFLVAWSDRRSLNKNIYAKMYDSTGAQRGVDFQINDEILNDQITPNVGMCESGSFAVAWMDNRHIGHYDIFARLFNSAGTPQGVDFQVNTETGTNHSQSAVAFDSTGKFLIAWNRGQTYARRYGSAGTALGDQFVVDHGITNASTDQPTVAMGRQGNFHIVLEVGWENYHIMAQRYDSSATVQGSIYQIDDNMGHSWQSLPAVAMDREGKFTVAWCDSFDYFRRGDIYFQRFDAGGNIAGGNVKVVTESPPGRDQLNPAVAMTPDGKITVAYSEYYNWRQIWINRYDASGAALGGKILVGDSSTYWVKHRPAVASGGSGLTAVAWEDPRACETTTDTFDIYLQFVDSTGALQGVNTKVNDDATLQFQKNVSVAMSQPGMLWVVWQDKRNGNYDIYAQRYNSSGTAVGANFKVNDNAGTTIQMMPSVACDSAGNAVVVWQDKRNGSYDDIYAQRYDAAGAAVGSNFKVNGDIGSYYQYNPSVACAPTGDKFVICWTDYRNADGDPEVMAQGYASGSAVGGNFQVTDDDNFPYHHQTTARCNVAANDNRVAFAWTDNRRHKGYDVYARVTDWDFNITVVQLPTPVLSNPANGVWQGTGTFHCSWIASKKAKDAPVYYVVKAYQLPDTINPVLVDTTSLTADTLTLASEARYAWRVEARDDAGSLPGISGLWRFGYDKTPPTEVNLTGPADSLITNQNSVAFGWRSCTDAVSGLKEYAVVYALDPGFSSGLAETTLTDTSLILSLADSNYYWMVEARDTAGNVNVSPTRYLIIDATDPLAPALILPADNDWQSSDTAVCSWGAVSKLGKASEVNYVIQLDTVNYFPEPLREDTTDLLSDTFNLAEGKYYWRVAAFDLAGNSGPYSGTRMFGIDHTAPDIQYVTNLPDDPSSPYGPYEVSSLVYDLSGVKAAYLFKQINGGSWDSTAMFFASDSLRDSIPELLPATDETLSVSYYIRAADMLDHQNTSSTFSFKAIGPLGVSGTTSTSIPTVYALNGAYPNPSKGKTTFKYQLPRESRVSLTVYNVVGQVIKRFDIGKKPAGYHQVDWNDNTLPNGVYICQLRAGNFSATRKLLMVR